MRIKVRLLGHLKELTKGGELEIEASSWREALRLLRDSNPAFATIITREGEPAPGYMVFVDGTDYRIAEGEGAEEIVVLPIVHGGGSGGPRELSWEDISRSSAKVAESVERSSYKVDVVIGILRGGAVPAILVADLLDVSDVGMIEIKLYKGRKRGERAILRQPLTIGVAGKSVLIVDDVSDSGMTLQMAIDYVRHHAPKEIRTATLYVKPWTALYPDYYAESTEDWLVFPWEKSQYKRGS